MDQIEVPYLEDLKIKTQNSTRITMQKAILCLCKEVTKRKHITILKKSMILSIKINNSCW